MLTEGAFRTDDDGAILAIDEDGTIHTLLDGINRPTALALSESELCWQELSNAPPTFRIVCWSGPLLGDGER